jgi:hypothetical protein
VRLAISGIFLFVTVAAAAPFSARSYRNEAARISVIVPPSGWELAPQSTYPRILATWSQRDARLTLSADRAPHPDLGAFDAQALLERSRPALQRQGFYGLESSVDPVDGARRRLHARLEGGRRFLLQLYVVEEGWSYVLTLVAPTADEKRLTTEFDDTVRSLVLAGP